MSLPTDNNPNLPKRCGLCFQVAPFLFPPGYCAQCLRPTITPIPTPVIHYFTPNTFKLKLTFTSIFALLPWFLMAISIITYHQSVSNTWIFSNPIPLPILLFILSVILLPFCGLFAVISGHITRRSIRTTSINPTTLARNTLIFALVVAYMDLLALLALISALMLGAMFSA